MRLSTQDRLCDAAIALATLAGAPPAVWFGWKGPSQSAGALAPWLWASATAVAALVCAILAMVAAVLTVPGALNGCEMGGVVMATRN